MTVYMKLKYLENKATKRKNCKRSYSVVFIVLSNQGPVIINSREAGRDFERQPKMFEVIWGGLPNFLFKYWIVYCEIKACLDVLIFKDATKALRKKTEKKEKWKTNRVIYDMIFIELLKNLL
jgi:hypothetical protein